MTPFFEQLSNILFLDIETASATESFAELDPRLQPEWIRKERLIRRESVLEPGELFFDRAGIHAEFGKVICVGVGFFQAKKKEKKHYFRSKVFAQEEEKETLLELKTLLEKKKWILCAHNGKEFDFPYLARRMVIQGIPLPEILNLFGKKPWEIIHQDTMEMWKFGDRRSYTSLELLAELMGISGAKADLSGDQVNRVFYKENGLARINEYCLEDVIVVAQLYLRFHFLDLVAPENIVKL